MRKPEQTPETNASLESREPLTASIRTTDSDIEINSTWKSRRQCRGMEPNFFFPHDSKDVEIAKEYCQGCPVINECLEYALENNIKDGVWGGMSESDRRRLKR